MNTFSKQIARLDCLETIQSVVVALYGGEASEHFFEIVRERVDQEPNSDFDACFSRSLDALQDLEEDERLREAIEVVRSMDSWDGGDREAEEASEAREFYEEEAREQAAYLAWWQTA